MAARGLIQNGCTSAVEAGVVGTPALAFRPHVSDQFEVELSNRVSRDCRSLPELIAALKSLRLGTTGPGAALTPCFGGLP